MKIIEVVTKRGDSLYGVTYGEENKNMCIIITNGTGGNIFENKFLQVIGEECEKNNICYVCAHNSGAFQIIDLASKNKNRSGVAFETFDNCIEDLDAYVKWAKENGYKKIIIGGHSYGTNKVIYYLYKTKSKNVDKYILISPTDTREYLSGEKEDIKKIKPIAENYRKEGRLNEIVPILFDGYNYYSAKAFLDWLENENNNNIPIYNSDADYKQIKSIKIDGLYIMGQRDPFARRNAENHLNVLYNNCGNKNSKIKVINDTSHTFKNKEKELADEIIAFAKK